MLRMTRGELNTLAGSLGIPHGEYKNKRLLIDEIERRKQKPGERCYNTTDPCTLEPLDEIDPEYLIEWTQFDHRFGADIRSLKYMFEHNEVAILPWAIDFYSGIRRDSMTPEIFKQTFDMKRNTELFRKVESFQPNDNASTPPKPEMSLDSEFLHTMEALMDSNPYGYGVILNIIESPVPDMYENLSGRIMRVLRVLHQYASDGEILQIQLDIYYYYCYMLYTSNGFGIKDRTEHLRYVLHVFSQFSKVMGDLAPFIISLIFME